MGFMTAAPPFSVTGFALDESARAATPALDRPHGCWVAAGLGTRDMTLATLAGIVTNGRPLAHPFDPQGKVKLLA